ncbi:DUF4402 domain-containing protein [Bacteroidales bacterium MB20-C3-3]|nr:DUF4402 domain-containing protein [Bacteroidales bacterium MB20-C3-3]WRQ32744.1 DUF4402 domain-containing protein [Bacteroidales bacterium MB20-C3-3]
MKAIKFFAIAILFSGVSVMASAQNPKATGEASASATIVTPISILWQRDLAFGNIIASAEGGSVTVNPDGAIDHSGVKAPSIAGITSSASFKVDGMADATYAITLPADNAVILKKDGKSTVATEQMKLTGFSNNATKKLTGGTETFEVGATLNVVAGQVAGDYTATFNVIVNYN